VELELLVSSWIITVFTNSAIQNFGFESALKIWDGFMVEKWIYIVKAILAIFTITESLLLKLKFDKLLKFFSESLPKGSLTTAKLSHELNQMVIEPREIQEIDNLYKIQKEYLS